MIHEMGQVATLEGPPLATADGVGALTLGGFIREVCARAPENEALVFDDPLLGGTTVRWTYRRLAAEAERFAKALISCGTGRGSRIALLMGNRPEAVAAFFGAALAGAVVVPLSTFSPGPELHHLIKDCDATVLVTQRRMGKRDFVADVSSLVAGPEAFPFLGAVVVVGEPGPFRGWDEFLAGGETISDAHLEARIAQTSPADEGLIIYSSGTTDKPKGMLHNHRAPTLQFWLQAQIFGRHERTRMWTALPMFWTAGMNTAMGATLAAGGCWVMQEGFDAGQALRLMARERVTEPYTLPHQTAALEEHPEWEETDLSSLTCVFGKSAFARHPRVTGDTSWNMPVAYGLSETCAIFITHRSDTPRELMKQSMGRLLPGNRLRVVDPESGAVLGPDQDGELAISGPTLMEHYLHRTRDVCFDPDGFFHTGDVGFYDTDGFVHWTGRRTEMIKTGGANVSPAEIEVQLRAHPAIKLARAVGLPDPRLTQVVVLCVTLKDGMEATPGDIQEFLRARIASYKVPKHVLFFADGEIPMTNSATKVRDDELVALAASRLTPSPPRSNR
ncbi:MAG: AMP-binding protein [Acidimicrobiales bacterium]